MYVLGKREEGKNDEKNKGDWFVRGMNGETSSPGRSPRTKTEEQQHDGYG